MYGPESLLQIGNLTRAGSLQTEITPLLVIFLTNMVIAITSALLVVGVRASDLSQKRSKLLFLFSALGSLVPGIGPILIILLGLAIPVFGAKKRDVPASIAKLPPFAPEIPVRPAHFGAGGASMRLRHSSGGKESKIQALLAIERHQSSEDVNLIREVMNASDDSIRLLAYTSLDRRETTIQKLIHRVRSALDETSEASQIAILRRELADLHLELVYQGLTRQSLAEHHLEEAKRYIDAARPSLHTDPRLAIIEFKLYRFLGDITQSSAALAKAEQVGAAPARVLAYRAEISWERREYSAVRGLLKSEPLLKIFPKIGPVAYFWCHGDKT